MATAGTASVAQQNMHITEPLLQTDGKAINGEGAHGMAKRKLPTGEEAGLEANKSAPDLDLEASGGWYAAFFVEAKKQVIFAMPMVGMNVLQYMLNLVAVIYVGHLGELTLAASSLSTTMVNMSGHIMLLSLASSLETFCGQAFGAGQYSLVGLYTQRAMLVLTIFCIPVAFFWWYMEPALILMGQDEEIAELAGIYARWLLPSLFASGLTQPLIKFYQAQSQTVPLAVCQLAALLVHIPLIYIFIWPLGFGFVGAAISASLAWWINLLLLAGYLRFSKNEVFAQTWVSWTREALDLGGLWEFTCLAIPSSIMICLEYWCFEVNVIFSGLLENPQLQVRFLQGGVHGFFDFVKDKGIYTGGMSAFTICYNTVTLAWMMPYGISAAVSTRVANELGAGHPNAARFATRVAYGCVSVCSFSVAVLLLLFRRQWAGIFINEDRVLQLTSRMMPFVAFISLMDGFTGVNAGSIRGIGSQAYGAIVNLGSYYGIGLPAAYVLAFPLKLGAFGLWMGLIAGQGTQVVLLAIRILLFTNWVKAAETASRLKEEEEESQDCQALPQSSGSYHTLPMPSLLRRNSLSLISPAGSYNKPAGSHMKSPVGSLQSQSHMPVSQYNRDELK